MKFYFSIFFFFISFNLFSQLQIEQNKSRYICNNIEYYITKYKIKNTSNKDIIFWLKDDKQKDSIVNKQHEIFNYFFNRKGNDFCFADIINEVLTDNFKTIIYTTFIKHLSNNEFFIVYFISTNNYYNKLFLNQIVYTDINIITDLFPLDYLKLFLYKNEEIIIFI